MQSRLPPWMGVGEVPTIRNEHYHVYQSIYLALPTYLPFYLFIYLSTYPHTYLPTYLSTYRSMRTAIWGQTLLLHATTTLPCRARSRDRKRLDRFVLVRYLLPFLGTGWPQRPHKDPIFWLKGPGQAGFQKPWLVESLCSGDLLGS